MHATRLNFREMTLGQLKIYAREIGLSPTSDKGRREIEEEVVEKHLIDQRAERNEAHRKYVSSRAEQARAD